MSSTPSSGRGSHAVGVDGADGAAPRRRRRWLLPLLIGIAMVILLLLLSRCGSSSTSSAGSTASSTTSSTASTSASSSASTSDASASPDSSAAAGAGASSATAVAGGAVDGAAGGAAGAGGAGSLTTAGGAALLPLAAAGNPHGGLASVTGQQVTATAVTVQSVPADEGFWVGTSETERAWVQLSGAGESPFTVQAGQTVSFTATVVPNAPGFAATAGVDEAEGASQLTAEGQHLEADRSSLTQAG